MLKRCVVVGLLVLCAAAPSFAGRCAVCTGDCNGDGKVTVNETITVTQIANNAKPVSACPAADANRDGKVTIDELQATVANNLTGCPTKP